MSKVKEVKTVSPSPETETVAIPALPRPIERLAEVDKLALELAKSRRETALATAKTALAQNENAELSYKYIVLQLYMKYGLNEHDAVSETGEIIRGGAVQYPQAQTK
jgi:hypothetical protein